MRLARGCALSSAACVAGDRLAAVFVRFPLPAAFVAAGFAVVPPGALGVAGFRFLDLLDWDLDGAFLLLFSIRRDMRIARLSATLWRGALQEYERSTQAKPSALTTSTFPRSGPRVRIHSPAPRFAYQISLNGRTSTSNDHADFGCVARWYTVSAISLGLK